MINNTSNANIKYTAILPRDCLDELRILAEKKMIPSVNQGIRAAVVDYIEAHKLREYQRRICEAAADSAFIARTMETQKAFEAVDAEAAEQW